MTDTASIACKRDFEATPELIGTSSAMRKVRRELRKITAAHKVPVLISGESGTGKELAALAIHRNSNRSDAPFIAVNCGALPANLIQSELFGHEKGAFTGALCRGIGRIEAAHGGTIFLDEIGDLPLELQVNLLRFLQEKTIERVGATQSIAIDTHVIAATHLDLAREVENGRFREDLFYRLNVLAVTLPPLRERQQDIELLANHYLHKFAVERKGPVHGFSDSAITYLKHYAWPGNVRELVNRVHRAVIMHEQPWISAAELGFKASPSPSINLLMSLEQARQEADKQAIALSLKCTSNNVSAAARQLGITRTTMYRLMEKYDFTAH